MLKKPEPGISAPVFLWQYKVARGAAMMGFCGMTGFITNTKMVLKAVI